MELAAFARTDKAPSPTEFAAFVWLEESLLKALALARTDTPPSEEYAFRSRGILGRNCRMQFCAGRLGGMCLDFCFRKRRKIF